VIFETLRIHSTSSLGLPRVVPPGPAVVVAGRAFLPGTVLSVPSYTMHHSAAIWGADVEQFDPDRWAEDRITAKMRAAFIPFSVGPRACVGRECPQCCCVVGAAHFSYSFFATPPFLLRPMNPL
jgi:benzoate 4-monooxygenase